MNKIEDRLILSFFTQLGIKQFKKMQYLLEVCEKQKTFENLNELQKEKFFKEAKTVNEEPMINNNKLLNFADRFDKSTATEIKNKKLQYEQQVDKEKEKKKNQFNPNSSSMFSGLESSHQEQNYQENIFKCKKCGLIFKKQKQLQIHSLAHQDPQWKNNGIVCTICQSSFRRYDEFFEHNAIHFQKKKKNY